MKRLLATAAFLAAIAVALPARATLITFTANLTGAQQVPANASTATGFGTVVLDDVADTITVDLSWSGLIGGPATAAHIHGPGAPGVNAAVIFPFSGVPAATSGAIPEQVFSITPAQISDLEAGLYYMNIHDGTFPGGEIRGQLVPEPGTLALFATGTAVLVAISSVRRRTR